MEELKEIKEMLIKLDQRQQRFEEKQNRFEEKQNRFEEKQNRFEEKQNRFEEKQNQFEEKQNRFEEKQNQFEERQNRFEERQNKFEDRQNCFEVEQKSMKEILLELVALQKEMRQEMREGFRTLNQRLACCQIDMQKKVDVLFDANETRKEQLEKIDEEIPEIKSTLFKHSIRIQKLESELGGA